MRVQWTIFGDTGFSSSVEARAALVDRFASMAVERPRAIMLLEIANEGWQNGFSGEAGTAELHALTRRLQGRLRQRRLGIPVAPTSPEGADCESWLRMYRGSDADVATMHFERSTSDGAGPWLPAILPWAYRACEGMPAVGVNNEPIGPGSSVVDDENPTRLVTSAAISVISGIPLYVFHTRAGIRGDIAFAEVPNVRQTFDGFAALRRTLPPAAATGRAFDLRTPGQPMQLLSPSWAEGGSEGVLAGYGTVLGDDLYVVLAGIKGGARLRSGRAMEVDVIEPLTGRTTRRLTVEAGTTFDITAADAALLRARLL
jgi:hypothetical protein